MNKKHIEKLEKTDVSVFEKKLHAMASSGDSFLNKIARIKIISIAKESTKGCEECLKGKERIENETRSRR